MSDISAERGRRTGVTAAAWGGLAPGLAMTFALAAIAFGLQRYIGIAALSPLVIAMLLGIAIRNGYGGMPSAHPGIAFSLRHILRFAIVLLGFQLTLTELAAVGPVGLPVIAVTLLATFIFTKLMARVLGVERKLGELIAAGTSVCGASAVLACNTVTRGSDEDVAYAIACVTVFGSLSMLTFPLIGTALALSPESYGVWVGATIHEVAQVVGAAFAHGDVAGETGTVAKLSRVILLAPLILALSRINVSHGGDRTDTAAPTPWFVFGFIAVMILNSYVELPSEMHHGIVTATAFLLTVALAAMGLETDIGKLRMKGLRPLALGAIAWGFISVLGLALALLV